MPPSSSGGVAMAVILNVLDEYPMQLGMGKLDRRAIC